MSRISKHPSCSDNGAFEADAFEVEKNLNSGIGRGMKKSVSMDLEDFGEDEEEWPQSSPPHSTFKPLAVSVTNACKSYETGKTSSLILNNFTMSVKQGTIYSLLGASGCGKTTLLACIVGLRTLNSGDITVLGGKPGTKESGVPGKRVGYMPQETALFPEFSIFESLKYYGRLYSMTWDEIEENISFLMDLLKMPPGNRRVSSLSGGQQRRVSFACSMIHNPELLLLDEPTVGVDALLRQSIWDHLEKLTATGKTTVIITTHYIEEARSSHSIGLMRNGKLLVEDSPDYLLKKYKTNLLEDIVMELCLKDTGKDDQSKSVTFCEDETADHNNDYIETREKYKNEGNNKMSQADEEQVKNWSKLHRASVVAELRRKKPAKLEEFKDSWNRLVTLSIKNILTLLRNVLFLSFILFCPAMQVVIVCLAIGGDPKGLKFAVVNYEVSYNSSSGCRPMGGCPFHENYTGLLSCQFLHLMDKDYLHFISYKDEESAYKDVLHSEAWGIVVFPKNYTQSFKDRSMFGINAEINSVYGSRINVRMDASNKQIGTQIRHNFYLTTAKMMKNFSLECGVEPVKSEPPVHFEKPVYGHNDMDFREYIAPSLLLGIIFFFPLSSSGLNFIKEKRMGTFDRSKVAGVTTAEFMFAYTLVQCLILVIQAFLAMAILVLAFKIDVRGSISLASILAIIVGVAGISVGFVMSAVCSEEIQAVLLAMGMFTPNLLLAGLIWPLEAMPSTLQSLAYALPCTLACESMRSIISRGVGLSHPKVWPGFISTLLWILVYWITFAIIHKLKARK